MRSSTKEALDRFFEKEAKKNSPKKKRKNLRPEKDVEQECVIYMRAQGWSVEIFEAKATYDPRRGVWRNQSMKAGVCDCQGADADGRAVFVEFKAPGRLKTFNLSKNYRQKEYLLNKINSNAFACVTDSAQRLAELYAGWIKSLQISKDAAKVYLLKSLP